MLYGKWNISVSIILMLTADLQTLFVGNRQAEKPLIHHKDFQTPIEESQYSNLMVSILKLLFFTHSTLCLIAQYCQCLKIKRSTAFLAKVYLDIVLTKLDFSQEQELLKISICCVWMAVKCHQNGRISTDLTPEIICQHGNNQFTLKDIISLELELFQLLDMKLIYTTPYDSMHAFFESFPWLSKIKEGLPQIFDFVVTLPEVSCETSDTFFYACFLAFCQIKQVQLSEFQGNVVNSQITDKDKVKKVKQLIVAAFQGLTNDDTDSESDENCDIMLPE